MLTKLPRSQVAEPGLKPRQFLGIDSRTDDILETGRIKETRW